MANCLRGRWHSGPKKDPAGADKAAPAGGRLDRFVATRTGVDPRTLDIRRSDVNTTRQVLPSGASEIAGHHPAVSAASAVSTSSISV